MQMRQASEGLQCNMTCLSKGSWQSVGWMVRVSVAKLQIMRPNIYSQCPIHNILTYEKRLLLRLKLVEVSQHPTRIICQLRKSYKHRSILMADVIIAFIVYPLELIILAVEVTYFFYISKQKCQLNYLANNINKIIF